MFDPFGDFNERGYLQNTEGIKDLGEVKRMEHVLFNANMGKALSYLEKIESVKYQDFLLVHKILFGSFYHWAGKDRSDTFPDKAVSKGKVLFSHPSDSRLAIEHGLALASDANKMRSNPGEVMGFFAYGHPFLDGNGRTMLLVHMELCDRAGFSIQWEKADKVKYLKALTEEIRDPKKRELDSYLSPFVSSSVPRAQWISRIGKIRGLDGTSVDVVEGDFAEQRVSQAYSSLKASRGYGF